MAKQQFMGAHVRSFPLYYIGEGWRHQNQSIMMGAPVYTYWRKTNDNKVITLWWNGARWVAWIRNVLIAESTDHKDLNDPPFDWAEDVYTLANQ